ncbi:MAG: ATP synthase F1 subunit delta, partial [Acidobacteriota bacterium]|nr:ATP synthase F1 subunit delta [Acidobacteriota bacterium]
IRDAGLVAKRYAQALSDAVADDAVFAEVRRQVRAMADLVRDSEELRHAFANPVIPTEAKARVARTLAERLGGRPETLRFLDVVARNERLVLLVDMADAVDGVGDRREGVHEVEISSAAPLPDELRSRLAGALGKVAGGKIRITERVDPALLGGIVARVGATVFDGSLRTRLTALRSRLTGTSQAAG